FYLGTTAERIYGSWRFLVIYFLAGIGGGLASFAFTVNVSAGASGAIFGLFGALLFFGLTYKKIFFLTMGKGLLVLSGINFLFFYFLYVFGGGLAIFSFTVYVSACASCAIFGLFGALLFFGLTYKKIFFQTMGKGLLILIGINVVFGFVVPQIDNGAHLGGL